MHRGGEHQQDQKASDVMRMSNSLLNYECAFLSHSENCTKLLLWRMAYKLYRLLSDVLG